MSWSQVKTSHKGRRGTKYYIVAAVRNSCRVVVHQWGKWVIKDVDDTFCLYFKINYYTSLDIWSWKITPTNVLVISVKNNIPSTFVARKETLMKSFTLKTLWTFGIVVTSVYLCRSHKRGLSKEFRRSYNKTRSLQTSVRLCGEN